MNLTEMKLFFQENNVPDDFYVIDGLGSGEVDGIGMIDGRWASYYSERGQKSDIQYFDSEEEACVALIVEVSSRVKEEFGKALPKLNKS